jgi:hypothetical protein
MKISRVREESFHADGERDGRLDRQTDMTKLMVAFRNLLNVPKKGQGWNYASILQMETAVHPKLW